MDRVETRLNNKNKFKLGLFSANCSNGLTMTKASVRWTASWDNNVKAAQLADAADAAGPRAATGWFPPGLESQISSLSRSVQSAP